MENHHPDFGTGQKKLSIYIFGVISCAVLTFLAFNVVMMNQISRDKILTTIYVAAIIQFLIQVICFLRLNTETRQAQINVMSILFTLVILITIVVGSIWIMWNLNYYMMH